MTISLSFLSNKIYASSWDINLLDRKTNDSIIVFSITNNFLEKLADGNTEWAIEQLSSKVSTETKEKIRKNLSGKVIISLDNLSQETLWENQFKISWRYIAKWEGWGKNWFRTYLVFEKENWAWKIIDTDIYTVGEITQLMIGVFSIFALFIWMLINCASKPNQPWKTKWLVIIILVPLWSIFYFFLGRKSLKNKE